MRIRVQLRVAMVETVHGQRVVAAMQQRWAEGGGGKVE